MQFTYRNPARVDRPVAAPWPAVASLVVGARRYGHGRTDAAGATAPVAARVARYATDDHYGALRARARGQVADRLRRDGWQARVLVDDNALVDRAAAHRAGLGWFGKNANVLVPGSGSWVVLGSVLTDAAAAGRGRAGARRLRRVHPLPRRLPHRGHRGPRRGRRPPLPGLAGAGRGGVPDRAPRRARRPALRLRRLPGGVPAVEPADGRRRSAARRRRPGVVGAGGGPPGDWVDVLDLLAADDATLLARFGRWYIPRREPRYLRRNALVVLGNIGRAGRPARCARALRRALADPDPMVRAHAVWAARRLGRARPARGRARRSRPAGARRARPPDRCGARSGARSIRRSARMSHLLVTNDFPPKAGWHPVLPVGALAPPAARGGDRAHHGPPRARPTGTASRPSGSSGSPPSGAAAHAGAGPARSTGWPTRSTPPLVLLDPALPLGAIGPRLGAALRRRACTAPRSSIPGRLPGRAARPLARGAARRRRWWSPPGSYPAAEGGAGGRSAAAHRGDPTRRRRRPVPSRSTPPRGAPPGPASACRPTPRSVLGLSRLVPRKGFDVLIRAVAGLAADPSRSGGGHRRIGPRPAPASSAWPGAPAHRCASWVGSTTTTCPLVYGMADVFAMLCRNRWFGLEQEGFGIVFLEAAAAGVPQLAGASGGSGEAVVDGVTGSVVRDPRSVAERRAGRSPRCSTIPTGGPGSRPAARASGRGRAHLRRRWPGDWPMRWPACEAGGDARSRRHRRRPGRRRSDAAARPGDHPGVVGRHRSSFVGDRGGLAAVAPAHLHRLGRRHVAGPVLRRASACSSGPTPSR